LVPLTLTHLSSLSLQNLTTNQSLNRLLSNLAYIVLSVLLLQREKKVSQDLHRKVPKILHPIFLSSQSPLILYLVYLCDLPAPHLCIPSHLLGAEHRCGVNVLRGLFIRHNPQNHVCIIPNTSITFVTTIFSSTLFIAYSLLPTVYICYLFPTVILALYFSPFLII
jgi:hypothetical protein